MGKFFNETLKYYNSIMKPQNTFIIETLKCKNHCVFFFIFGNGNLGDDQLHFLEWIRQLKIHYRHPKMRKFIPETPKCKNSSAKFSAM